MLTLLIEQFYFFSCILLCCLKKLNVRWNNILIEFADIFKLERHWNMFHRINFFVMRIQKNWNELWWNSINIPITFSFILYFRISIVSFWILLLEISRRAFNRQYNNKQTNGNKLYVCFRANSFYLLPSKFLPIVNFPMRATNLIMYSRVPLNVNHLDVNYMQYILG